MFMEGVLVEFDRRGGFRFWGTKRRIHIPGQAWRARRLEKRERRWAEASGWARWTRGVQRRPWLAAGAALVVLLGLAIPALSLRLGSSDAGVDPPGHDHAQGLRPDRRRLRGGHERLVPARRRARPEGRQGRGPADRRRGQGRRRLHLRLAARDLAGRDRWPRSPPTRGPARRTRRPPTRSTGCATTSCRRWSASTGTTVEVGGFTASNEDFSQRGGRQAPAVHRRGRAPERAAAARGVPLGRDPDQGGDHEPALDRRRAGLRDARSSRRATGPSLLGIGTGPIESFVPVLMFAIVFGLSMDYEVFLISRVHEEWEPHDDASASVAPRAPDHRPGDHRGGLDHDRRVRLVRARRRPRHQAVRDRPGQRRLLRRRDHPLPARAGDHGDARPQGLVAPVLARPPPAAARDRVARRAARTRTASPRPRPT